MARFLKGVLSAMLGLLVVILVIGALIVGPVLVAVGGALFIGIIIACIIYFALTEDDDDQGRFNKYI